MKKKINRSVAYLLVLSMATSVAALQFYNNSENYESNNSKSNYSDKTNSDTSSKNSSSNYYDINNLNQISKNVDYNKENNNNNLSNNLLASYAATDISPRIIDENDIMTMALDADIKYFPVTMYNYESTVFNKATSKLELSNEETASKEKWEGFYFDDGFGDVYGMDVLETEGNISLTEGYYVIYNTRAAATVNAVDVNGTYQLKDGAMDNNVTRWKLERNNDGSYTIQDPVSGLYMSLGDTNGTGTVVAKKDAQSFNFIQYNYYTNDTSTTTANGVMIKKKDANLYLNDDGGKVEQFTGWNSNTDEGSVFYIAKVGLNDTIANLQPMEIDENVEIEDGKYKMYNIQANAAVEVRDGGLYNAQNFGLATNWNIKRLANGNYTLQDETGMYLLVSNGGGTVTENKVEYTITSFSNLDNDIEIKLADEDVWLNDYGRGNQDVFKGWTGNDYGCAFRLFNFEEDAVYEQVIPSADEDGIVDLETGKYVLYNVRANKAVELVNNNGTYRLQDCKDKNNSTQWTITKLDNGNYTIMDTNGKYLSTTGIQSSNAINVNITASETQVEFSISKHVIGNENEPGYTNAVMLCDETNVGTTVKYYINDYGADNNDYYGGYCYKDQGDGFYLYKVDEMATKYIGSKSVYAAWNHYTSRATLSDGIVKDKLDSNKNLQFNHIEAGVFDANTEVKDIYTNVEMPFVYEYEDVDDNGKGSYTYTFDSENMSSRFNGTPASNTKLGAYEAQIMNSGITGWFPFNEETNVTNPDYHFGMTATIPFTMSQNGRINPLDEESEPIRFEFSGDDDIWIFIDGQLVLDLGGIHDRVGAELDFSTNTWKLVPYEGAAASDNPDKYEPMYTTEGKALNGYIFNGQDVNGVLNQTIESFAATDIHELTIFYLERGKGESNCKIKFNFPMKDYVSVTKQANQSYTVDEGGNLVITSLTSNEQKIVDNINFGFTLYKRTVENGVTSDAPVANTSYSLMNKNGQTIDTPSTDSNGHFYLKNGQTARFITNISSESGDIYYVVEDSVKGFSYSRYSYAGEADSFEVDGVVYYEGAAIEKSDYISSGDNAGNPIQSSIITVIGNEDTNDSLQFICENFYDASMPNGSLYPQDDIIVIDYGLGVKISPLVNDVWRGDRIKITSVTGAKYGTATIDSNDDNVIDYQLTKQLSGIEKLTYTAMVTPDITGGVGVTGTIYVIPATSMYYEENFAAFEEDEFVNYNNGNSSGEKQDGTWIYGWESTIANGFVKEFQEAGVVGTLDDSPYGSDRAYLSDSEDSNGTSMHVDTTLGAAQFSYKFVGTGTTFYARTSDTSAYIRVVITNNEGNIVDAIFRDTIYTEPDEYITDEEGNKILTSWKQNTLYNIPVYSKKDLPYDTYTVTVTIAKQMGKFGKDFWLDGIRIYNPLGTDLSGDFAIADSAYAIDGEANNSIVTLRDKILNDITGEDENGELIWSGDDKSDGNFVLFTDTNGVMTSAKEYQSNGPKEEVYLKTGQSISFSLSNWDSNQHFVYLGIKAPYGSGKIIINGTEMTINNTADCYYLIHPVIIEKNGVKYGNFEITAGTKSDGNACVISLTTLKVTGTAEFSIYEGLGEESTDWSSVDYIYSDIVLDGVVQHFEQYKVIVAKGDTNVVSIQKPFGDDEGIYITFKDTNISNVKVDGEITQSMQVEGSGMLIHLSNFTKKYSTVVILNNDQTEKAVLYIYNKNGTR